MPLRYNIAAKNMKPRCHGFIINARKGKKKNPSDLKQHFHRKGQKMNQKCTPLPKYITSAINQKWICKRTH
jgi:hypothetical protein